MMQRRAISFEINGHRFAALEGDTLLVALLSHATAVRDAEFGDGQHAGFCMREACQDCWLWTAEGERVRACATPVVDGMRVVTRDVT